MAFSQNIPTGKTSKLLDQEEARKNLGPGCGAYVYTLHRETGTPFYVGKGCDNYRALDHVQEATRTERLTHKLNVIRFMNRSGYQVRYSLELGFESESDALAREKSLIREIGRHDLGLGPLTNQTDGGEGTSNPSEESRQRRRETLWGDEGEDDERNLANRWFQKIVSVQSVPIKSIGKYRVESLFRNREKFGMSERQAGALAASAIANRVMLEPGAIIPRRLSVDGVDMIVENGVGRDIISSNMASLVSNEEGSETFYLSKQGCSYLLSTLDQSILIDAGILEPNADLS